MTLMGNEHSLTPEQLRSINRPAFIAVVVLRLSMVGAFLYVVYETVF